jgi:DNA segregation ATPase FtsK/SpoIIIE, S-DNA-T family
MRVTFTVLDPVARRHADVVLDTGPEVTAGRVGAALARLLRPGLPAASLYVGGTAVDPRLSLPDSPLRAGALVSLGDPALCPRPEPAGLVEIRVVSGPDAGGVFRLDPGVAHIGADPGAPVGTAVEIAVGIAVGIEDPSLPASAVTVGIAADGSATVTPSPDLPAWLDGQRLAGSAPWPVGGQLAVGWSVLELATPTVSDAAVQPSEDGGGLDYNRPPRLRPPSRATRFRIPPPPTQGERRPLPILMAIAPLVLAVVMVVGFHQSPNYLAFALLSPVMVIGSYLTDRRSGRRSYRQRRAEYLQGKTALEAEARAALHAEEAARRVECPDPATVLLTAVGPRSRLWERRREDPDYLLVRLGTGDLPSQVVLDDPSREEHRRAVTWTALDVPVTVGLRESGVLGIAGPAQMARALACWVLAQTAVLHSPNDLQVYLLTDPSARRSWEWVRWLPHARPPDAQYASALVGTDADTLARRVAELVAIVSARRKALRESSSVAFSGTFAGTFTDPDVMVLLDGARRLRTLPGVIQILKEGPSVGVYAVCLDADERLLPAECQATVAVDPEGGLRVRQAGEDPVHNVRPEYVTPSWCERLARGLAPLRDISGAGEEAALPGSCRLLDLLALEPPTPEAIAARWAVRGRSTEALIGAGLDGPYAIDLRRDGPHGLVAGTTGAGKSELLQTLVASLAVANRPDAMVFVLVDYKGGSAFKDCVDLPHTAGMVTDLDSHLVERALESISAELRRRERLLADAGAPDIESYLLVTGANPGLPPLPRLLIVIDEFASLVRELPDFVTGLVDLARRGRSLGIHLILATQRPSGVVSPEIRANTDLRIALRVTDAAESADVIDAPDAARITKATPGRAYLRCGASSLVPVQAGRVGGRRPGTGPVGAAEPWVAIVDPARLGQPPPVPPQRLVAEEEVTDLAVLVEAIRKATQALGIPAQPSPWLPALPEQLTLDELPAPGSTPGRLAPIPYALDDLPARQQQRPACLDLATFGHLFAIGGPRSGRSQILRTIAGSIGRIHSAADVHLYGIDCGNGALLPVAELPHCGAVVRNTQTERAVRLIKRLGAEMQRRIELLGESGFADVTEQRAAVPRDQRLPHLVVLLDRWESFTISLGEVDNGALTEEVQRILREGASVGLHLVITGDRSLLSGRMSTLTEAKLVFRLPDRGDFSLIGINPRKVAETMPPGRALRAESGVETQVALLTPDASGQGQAAALARIAARASERDADLPVGLRPFRVDVLPARVGFEQAWALREATGSGSAGSGSAGSGSAGSGSAGSMWALVGIGGDTLRAYGPDLATGTPAFVVAGPPSSGRSTVLVTMARSLLRAGAGVIAITPRPSPLRRLTGEGVTVLSGPELTAPDLTAALAVAPERAVVLIDDAELLRDCSAEDELRALLRAGAGSGRALVIAGDAESICTGFSGWQVELKKARRGLLLAPQTITEGDLIGLRLPRSLLGQPVHPGRGLLHLGDGEPRAVQVPHAPE